MKKTMFYVTTILLLTSCSNSVKETLGLVKESPDEFQVISYKPLTIPANFELVDPDSPNDSNQSDSDLPFMRTKDIDLSNSDKKLLKHLGVVKQENVKKLIDQEYRYKQEKKDKANIIKKAVSNLQGKDNKSYINPEEEKERISKAQSNGKPINSGDTKNQQDKSVIERLFN